MVMIQTAVFPPWRYGVLTGRLERKINLDGIVI